MGENSSSTHLTPNPNSSVQHPGRMTYFEQTIAWFHFIHINDFPYFIEFSFGSLKVMYNKFTAKTFQQLT